VRQCGRSRWSLWLERQLEDARHATSTLLTLTQRVPDRVDLRCASTIVRCVDALTGSVSQLLEDGRIDFAIEVMSQLEDPVRSQMLLQDQYVVVVAARHPEIEPSEVICSQEAFDLDLYCRLPHVLHSFDVGTKGNVDAALAAVNRRRHVGLTLPHFFSIAKAVAGSRMIATFPDRLAVEIAPVVGLRVYQVPVALPPIAFAIIWHRRNDLNPGYSWFRHQIMSAARSLGQRTDHGLTTRFQPSVTPVLRDRTAVL
jgi:DNA-binding transcriptional LysR family regulator